MACCFAYRFCLKEAPVAQPVSGHYDKYEEHPAYKSEDLDEVLALSGIFPDINAVIDYRRERSDKRYESRGVRAVDEPRKIIRKGVKHDRCGYVGDDLA